MGAQPHKDIQYLVPSEYGSEYLESQFLTRQMWDIDDACKLITIGYPYNFEFLHDQQDRKRKKFEESERKFDSIQDWRELSDDNLQSQWEELERLQHQLSMMGTVFDRCKKLALKSVKHEEIKERDTRENWLKWAKANGYVVDHLEPGATDTGTAGTCTAGTTPEGATQNPEQPQPIETSDERRLRLLELAKEESSLRGKKGCIQRVANREGVSRQAIEDARGGNPMKVWRTLDELLLHVMQFLKFPDGETAKDKLNKNRARKIQTINDFKSGNDSMYPYRLTQEKTEEILNFCNTLDRELISECRKEMQKTMVKGLHIGFGRPDIFSPQRIPILPHLWSILKINFDKNSATNKKERVSYFDLRFLDWYELNKEEQMDIYKEFRELAVHPEKIMPDLTATTKQPESTGTTQEEPPSEREDVAIKLNKLAVYVKREVERSGSANDEFFNVHFIDANGNPFQIGISNPPSPRQSVNPPQQRKTNTSAATQGKKQQALAKREAVRAAMTPIIAVMPEWSDVIRHRKLDVASSILKHINSLELSVENKKCLLEMGENKIATVLSEQFKFIGGHPGNLLDLKKTLTQRFPISLKKQ